MPETKTAIGKVSFAGGKYSVTVNGKKHPLPVGTLVDASQVKRLAGKEVTVYFAAKPKNVVIAIQDMAFKLQPILCYYPPPPFFKSINPELQIAAVKVMVDKKIMLPDLAQQFGAEE